MNILKQFLLGMCAFAALLALAPGAKASQWDQQVKTTFSGPIEIPGKILPSGTYVFKILNVWGCRDVVQVSNADETRVLATAFAVTRYRTTPTSKAVFVLEERGANSPQAIQAWYYPGYIDGHQFVYSSRARLDAMTTSNPPAPVPASMNESAASPGSVPEDAPVMSAEANTSEIPPPVDQATDQNLIAQSQPPASASTMSGTTTNETRTELPKTASSTPLIASTGLLFMAAALGLKALASRVS